MVHPQPRHHYRRYASGQWQTLDVDGVREASVSLTVNNNTWLTWMCSPVALEALAIGFLYSEGFITSLGDVASVRVCSKGDNVDVWLYRDLFPPQRWARASGCVGGVTAQPWARPLPRVTDGAPLSSSAVGELMAQLYEAQQMYRTAGGIHASALSDGRSLFALAEDIGRHNTLDKLAGQCLLAHVVMTGNLLLTTGRLSSEMVGKAARMGVPIVISRSAPTSLAIELAERCGLTLIGYARRDSFNVYTCPERLLAESAPAGLEMLCPVEA